MNNLLKSTALITLFTLIGQVIAFATQIIMAALFGASSGMDAFLVASAIPQYISAVLLGALGVVFVPVFVHYLTNQREVEAWQIASSIINFTLLGLGILAIAGVLFSNAILNLTAPGLDVTARTQAVQIALITWPAVLGTAIILLLTGIYQSQSRFAWPAAVPVIGAFLSLGLTVILARRLGIIGLAIANTVGVLVQAGLLLPLALQKGRYNFTLDLNSSAVRQVGHLLLPLVLANVVAKATPVVDRFFASQMPEGSISHLGYAFRLFSVLSILISSGISTVFFPRMASDATQTDFSRLRQTMSAGMRFMWLAIAPAMTIGIVLAVPFVTILFRRGQFTATDAIAVASLIQIYLLALPPACLGSITARGFYVLKDTRTVALLASIESIAYMLYTAYFSRNYGVYGIAFSYVLYFNISLLWQVLIVHYKAGKTGGVHVVNSFVRTGVAALLSGVAAWIMTLFLSSMLLQLVLGALAGLVVYGVSLWFLQFSDLYGAWVSLRT